MPLALSEGPAPGPGAGPPSTSSSPRAGGHLPQTAHPPSRRWRCASGRWQAQAALRHGAAVFAPGPPRSGYYARSGRAASKEVGFWTPSGQDIVFFCFI